MELKDFDQKMKKTIDNFSLELTGVRTGRASANLLKSIKVSSYGTDMPIDQVATINVPENRLITAQVWDKSLLIPTEKAIRDSGLGLNPMIDGQLIRIPIPELNEERRKELTKIINKYSENSKVAIRNIRRDAMDQIKKQEKSGEIYQDDFKSLSVKIQEMTDSNISNIEKSTQQKTNEVMQV